MKGLLFLSIVVAVSTGHPGMVFGQEGNLTPASSPPPGYPETPITPPRPPGSISAGGIQGSGHGLGLIDGMIRLHVDDNSMLLLNPRYSFDDEEDMTAGLRLIDRRVFANQAFHTIYLSGEVRKTPSDNFFSTLASGYEHRTKSFTTRLRGYITPHHAELVNSHEETSRKTLPDHRIETTTTRYDLYEVPLSGAEAELGVRIPLPRWAGDMRFFGGWHYSDGDKAIQQDGWLTRIEWRPRKFLALEFVTYADREFSDTDSFIGAKIILPFGPIKPQEDMYWYDPLPFVPRAEITQSRPSRTQTTTTITNAPRRHSISRKKAASAVVAASATPSASSVLSPSIPPDSPTLITPSPSTPTVTPPPTPTVVPPECEIFAGATGECEWME